jgi:hypothetical protein
MAVSVSGLFVPTWLDILDTTQLAVDLDLETHKLAMFTNTITPNFSTDTAYGVAPYNANEVSGTGYTAGGTVITTTTVTESPTGTVMWDAADTQWASSTITNARYPRTQGSRPPSRPPPQPRPPLTPLPGQLTGPHPQLGRT